MASSWWPIISSITANSETEVLYVPVSTHPVFTSRARTAHPAGPIVTLRFSSLSVCLFVCLSVQGLGRPGNELMVAAGMHGWFELVGLFASYLLLSTVEAQLSLHKRPINKLHDRVDSQSQLECISPPVGTPV